MIVNGQSVGSKYLRSIDGPSRRVSRDEYGCIRVAGRVACIDVAAALKVVVLGFWEICECAIQSQLHVQPVSPPPPACLANNPYIALFPVMPQFCPTYSAAL